MAVATASARAAGGANSKQSLWGNLARRMYPGRRIRFTAQGVWLIMLTLGVGFAALNTGNNLLYLVLGMMLTLIGASGILSELSVGGLGIGRQLPDELYAGQPVAVSLTLHNRKRVLPSMGIRLFEGPGLDADVEDAYVVYLPAGHEQRQIVRYTFRRRGVHRMSAPFVETSYPFGLFRRGYRAGEAAQVLVYPRIVPVELDQLSLRSAGGDEELRRRGRGDEFFGLRAYHEGDDARAIHWKVSARRNRLMVRENAEQARQLVVVRFEPEGSPDFSAFDEAVSLTASYVRALLEAGYNVGYEGPGERVPPGVGRVQLARVLGSLALLAPGEGQVPAAASGALTRLVIGLRGKQISVGARS